MSLTEIGDHMYYNFSLLSITKNLTAAVTVNIMLCTINLSQFTECTLHKYDGPCAITLSIRLLYSLHQTLLLINHCSRIVATPRLLFENTSFQWQPGT